MISREGGEEHRLRSVQLLSTKAQLRMLLEAKRWDRGLKDQIVLSKGGVVLFERSTPDEHRDANNAEMKDIPPNTNFAWSAVRLAVGSKL